jgi:hypothetical protein
LSKKAVAQKRDAARGQIKSLFMTKFKRGDTLDQASDSGSLQRYLRNDHAELYGKIDELLRDTISSRQARVKFIRDTLDELVEWKPIGRTRRGVVI